MGQQLHLPPSLGGVAAVETKTATVPVKLEQTPEHEKHEEKKHPNKTVVKEHQMNDYKLKNTPTTNAAPKVTLKKTPTTAAAAKKARPPTIHTPTTTKNPTQNTKKCGTNIMRFLQKFEKKDDQERTNIGGTKVTSSNGTKPNKEEPTPGNKMTEPTRTKENKTPMGTNLSAKKEPNKKEGDKGTKTSGTIKVKGRPRKIMQLDDNPTTLKDFLELKLKAREAKCQENSNLKHSKTTLSNPAAVLDKFMEEDRGNRKLGESSTN